MSASAEEIVTSLLSMAKLTVSDDEKATFVRDFPLIREGADSLYLPDLEFEEPAVRFNPLDYYPAAAWPTVSTQSIRSEEV
ncbi:hypothetical protein [Pseudonocardia sp.]|jgi:Asp-tRNA(Asn)/Glu-tRNA(Gln) amidotransferase C subunit|uniref:hypothetical protein n=1 Tax=Pseudonocardia sp. TaxID=60912 RepID=UPI0031FDAD1F